MELVKQNVTLLPLLLDKYAKVITVPKDVCPVILLFLLAMYAILEDGYIMGLAEFNAHIIILDGILLA